MTTSRLFASLAAVAVLAAASWAAAQKGKGADPVKGKAIFEQCGVCHNADTPDKKIGPSLKGLFKRGTFHNGKKVTEKAVRSRVDEGGEGMPPFKDMLSAEEKDNLIAYLRTI